MNSLQLIPLPTQPPDLPQTTINSQATIPVSEVTQHSYFNFSKTNLNLEKIIICDNLQLKNNFTPPNCKNYLLYDIIELKDLFNW